jgi:hydroxyacylglutathione hydrolase
MRIRTFTSGPIMTNAFLAIDEDSREALIVDAPPDVTPAISQAIREEDLHVDLLVITHAHWDHIGAAQELVDALGLEVAAHPASVAQLEQPKGGPTPIAPVGVDRLLNDGDEVSVGKLRFQVVHTPGHAKGQVSLYSPEDHVMFGGDTLFPNGYGRTDIPGASDEETAATMVRLLDLPDDVTVYPGHGKETTIGQERAWMERITRGSR